MDTPEGWLSYLIRRRTFTLTIFTSLILILSVLSWFRIPIEVMPKENVPPFLYLRVEGKESMSPEKVELALTIPVEGTIRTLSGLGKFTSSTNNRGASLSLTYNPKTDIDLAVVNLQEALQDLESKGILDMKGVTISRLNPEASAIIKLSITHDNSIKEPLKLIKEDLRLGLESLPEVSKIEIIGLEPLLYEFNVPLSKILQFGMRGQQFASTLHFDSFREPMGEAHLKSDKFTTTLKGRLIVEDLSDVQTHNVGSRTSVTLDQVAKEKVIDKSKEEISRKNGESAVFIEVFSKDSANLFDLNAHIKEYLEKLKSEGTELSKLKFESVLNKTDDLKNAIDDVFGNLLQAMLITFAIVYLFLRKWRETIIIAITIPATLLATILILYLKGVSLNILTLSGLILGIGMVVDNAILVVERIEELKREKQVKVAAGQGATDVMLALLMATLTNALIFLPVAFVEGGDSFTDILKAFQLPILASLGASMFVALFFIPLVAIYWRGQPTRKVKSEEETSKKVVEFFRWMQKKRAPLAVLTLILVISVGMKAMDINQTDIESPRDPYSMVTVKFSADVPPEERRTFFESVEKTFTDHQTQIDYKFMVSEFNPQFMSGSLLVYPIPSDDSDAQLNLQESYIKHVIEQLPQKAGATVSLGFGGYTAGKLKRYKQLVLSGPKTAKLLSIQDDLRQKIKVLPAVDSVQLEQDENGSRSLVFLPHDMVLLQYGLNLSKLASEIASSMTSVSVSNLNLNGQQVGARINLLPETGIWTLDTLKELKIGIADGKFANLMDLGQLVPMNFLRGISRTEGLSSAKMFVYFKESLSDYDLRSAQSQVGWIFSNYQYPKGYGPPVEDSAARIKEMQGKSNFIIYLSALMIYLLLASMFESVLIPFAILFTIPLAIIFGISGLLLFHMDLDVMARLSLIILVGIGVNNAIILIDLILSLKKQGIKRQDAVVLGCAQRLKAVMMTTAIQVISVFPVALGKSKIMGIPYASLGVSIIAGMLFSTAITLMVLPMIYEFLDDWEQKLKVKLGLGK